MSNYNILVDLKQVFKNSFFSIFVQICGYIFPLIVIPVFVGVLNPDDYAYFIYQCSFIFFINIILDSGISTWSCSEIPLLKIKEKQKLIGSIYYYKFFSYIIALPILYLSIYFNKNLLNIAYDYLFFSIILFGIIFKNIWFFQAIQKIEIFAIINFIFNFIYAILILFFIKAESDFYTVLFFFGLLQIFIAVSIFIFIYKKGLISLNFDLKELKNIFNKSKVFILSRVCVSFHNSLPLIILSYIVSSSNLIFYSISDQVYQASKNLFAAFSRSLAPYLSVKKNITNFKFYTKFILFLSIVYAFFLIHFSPDITNYFIGESNKTVVILFYLFGFALVINVTSLMYGFPIFLAFGKNKIPNYTAILGSIIFIISVAFMFFFNILNLFSMAISVLLAETIILLSRYYFFRVKIDK